MIKNIILGMVRSFAMIFGTTGLILGVTNNITLPTVDLIVICLCYMIALTPLSKL